MKTATQTSTRAPLGRTSFAPLDVQTAVSQFVASSLLEVVQAMDGNKEARYNVAFDALSIAYTKALTHGDKRQLKAMLEAKGKGKCVTAMRNAIQDVGVLGLHKDDDTRADAIALAVASASTLFSEAVLTIKPKAKPKAKKVEKVVPVGKGAGEGADALPTSELQSIEMDNDVVLAYARTLDDSTLAALLSDITTLVMARSEPLKLAA